MNRIQIFSLNDENQHKINHHPDSVNILKSRKSSGKQRSPLSSFDTNQSFDKIDHTKKNSQRLSLKRKDERIIKKKVVSSQDIKETKDQKCNGDGNEDNKGTSTNIKESIDRIFRQFNRRSTKDEVWTDERTLRRANPVYDDDDDVEYENKSPIERSDHLHDDNRLYSFNLKETDAFKEHVQSNDSVFRESNDGSYDAFWTDDMILHRANPVYDSVTENKSTSLSLPQPSNTNILHEDDCLKNMNFKMINITDSR